MVKRSPAPILVLGWFGAITALSVLTSCRGDNADGSRPEISTKAMRASRVPQRIVGELTPAVELTKDAAADGRTLRRFGVDGGFIHVDPLRDREQLQVDGLAARESSGIQLEVEWRQSDLPTPSGAPETSLEGLEEARNKTRLRMRIELAAVGRMRAVFLGQGYPWPEGTEIRARADKMGQVLVWPDGKSYRNVVPGALRALFSERRLDMGPLFAPKATALAQGQWLSLPTTRSVLSTPVAEIQLDQASVSGSGLGAALLCRFLVELAGVEPDAQLCNGELLPLHAQLTNAPGGRLGFHVIAIGKKQDLSLASIQVPPENARFQSSGIPVPPGSALTRALLTSLRIRATAVAPPANPTAMLQPSSGLVAVNRTISLRALLIDGVTAAWVPPGGEVSLPELRNGIYGIAWRDLFGTHIEPPRNVSLPARIALGVAADPGG